MTGILVGSLVVLSLAVIALTMMHLRYRQRRPSRIPVTGTRRILFPFVADALSCRALDAALRLASAEDATLVPVFLARVSLQLPLDTPLPRQSGVAIPLQEAIEHRATAFGIAVDARIERGRNHRHALRQTIQHERFDRIVIAAAAHGSSAGFGPEDVAWLLENAPGEIVVLRPHEDEQLAPPAPRRGRRTRGGRTRSRSIPREAGGAGGTKKRKLVNAVLTFDGRVSARCPDARRTAPAASVPRWFAR